MNDVIAVTAFIGSIFGAGGGGEAANSDLLAKLRGQLGADAGYKAWSDVMLADDPEAPTTITRRFNYAGDTASPVIGSLVLDADSIQSIDPRQPPALAAAAPAARAGVELPRHGAAALGDRQLARGHGTAARLLLPGDRPADRPPLPRVPGAGRGRSRPRRCTS